VSRIRKRLIVTSIASLIVGSGIPALALEPVGSPATGPAPACPNTLEDGGACLGPLAPGAYRTTVFSTPFTFTVPDSWANYEDLPGNFLLVPPGGSLEGVDAGSSDYIGMYMGVAVGNPDGTHCDAPRPGVGHEAASMAAAYKMYPGIIASDALPVEVGGLSGFVIDLAFDPSSEAGCQPSDLPHPIRPFLVGTGPAGLNHVVIPGSTTRLYLLDLPTTNIVIEVADVDSSPGTADDYLDVIDSIEFVPSADVAPPASTPAPGGS
jgi:hypothetical protein